MIRFTFLLVILLLLPPMNGWGRDKQGDSVPKQRLMALVNQYRSHRDFEVVSIGGLGMSLLRGAARTGMLDDGADEDTRQAMEVIKGIKKVMICDYEDAEEPTRRKFNDKVSAILNGSPLLMEANDDGDKVLIYGLSDGDGENLRDLVIFTPSEGALVCLFGTIKAEAIAAIASK